MKNTLRRLFAVYIIFMLSTAVVYAADIQDPQAAVKPTSIQISPIRIDWEMHSGESRVGRFNVRNYADEPRRVSVKVENFFVSPNSEHVNLFGGDADHPRHMFNVIEWFSVPEDFTLAPGEGRDMEFTVTVPEGQPTNGYYGTILFETTNKDDTDEKESGAAQLGVNYRIGAIVTLAVRGNEDPKMSGSLKKFISSRTWYSDAPMSLTAEVLNDGNMHYKMHGEIIVTRFGKKFTTIEFAPEVMYPNAVRIFTKNVSFGTWDFGIYEATLHMQSEQNEIVMDAKIKNIYVLPKKGLIYCSAILFVAILFVWFVRNYVTIGIKKKQKTL